jgi:hypothetical protein
MSGFGDTHEIEPDPEQQARNADERARNALERAKSAEARADKARKEAAGATSDASRAALLREAESHDKAAEAQRRSVATHERHANDARAIAERRRREHR